MKYNYFSDGGHGWLKVKKTELNKLGISNEISGYSYMKNGFAYLEEDGDATLFIRTKKDKNEVVEIVPHESYKLSRIRNYQTYKPL